MIITRTPLRITFVGGGTDLRSFFQHEYGAVINAAIDKYVYITVNRKFDPGIRLKYSKTENVDSIDDIEHSLFREALRYTGISDHVEITSHADVPSRGSGLGSSSSFLVGLLHALYAYRGTFKTPAELARIAVHIERDVLSEQGGLQDQFIAAYGGLRYMEFHNEDNIYVSNINCKSTTFEQLQHRLMLFYTGITRKSNEIQGKAVANTSMNMDLLRTIKEYTLRLRAELQHDNPEAAGKFMHEYWLLKKQLTGSISNNDIDDYYDKAIAAGAKGGKILGAGGGGFFLFYVPHEYQDAVRAALAPLRELPFKFEREGSKIIYVADNFRPGAEELAPISKKVC